MDNIRVLVVEDAPIAAKMAEIILENLGHKVTIATTGAQAIAEFKKHQFDIIFLDLGLPDTDGFTITQTIRKLEKNSSQHTTIVALTAHIGEEIKQKSLDAGMDDFISKPLLEEQVKNIIEKYKQEN